MTTEEIVKAAREAGFGSSEIHQRIAEFKRLIDAAAAAEREKYVKLCDAIYTPGDAAKHAAAAIRARATL